MENNEPIKNLDDLKNEDCENEKPKLNNEYYENGKLKPQYWDRKPGWSSPCVRGMVYDEQGYLVDMADYFSDYD